MGCKTFEIINVWYEIQNCNHDKPLIWLFNVNDPESRLRLKLEEYDYDIIHNDIIHKAGRANTNTNALSHNAIREKQNVEEREVFTIEKKRTKHR